MKNNRILFTVVCTFLLCSTTLSFSPSTASDLFPPFPSIRPNVHFWTEVFSRYPTTTGILHDSSNLRIIYELIELVPQDRSRARRINRKRIKKAKYRYKKILEKLARYGPGTDPDSKRVADLFGPGATRGAFRKASHSIRIQVGQSDRFRRGLIRSGAYIDEIKKIFLSHGLPEELIFLPHVESSFNLKAYSKFGASGIWQFTRSTGKRFLTIGYTLDERQDPLLSSRAAAKFLKENHKKLKSWPLAITAYNHGVAGVLRAKRKLGGYETIFQKYRSRRFKFASRNFYPEFVAAVQVAKNYRDHFGELDLDRPGETSVVALEGYADVEDLCRIFSVDMETIRRLNTSLRAPVFEGQKYVPKGFALRLPARVLRGVTYSSNLQSIYRPRQRPSQYHRVKRGDTVGQIAQLNSLRISDLILANNLNKRATIFVNQLLHLPLPRNKSRRPVTPENRPSSIPAYEPAKRGDLFHFESGGQTSY